VRRRYRAAAFPYVKKPSKERKEGFSTEFLATSMDWRARGTRPYAVGGRMAVRMRTHENCPPV